MKFLHTSDWHIGRQLHNQSLLDDQAHVLEQIVALAREHKVDAVVVAGDIYDRSVPPTTAVDLLNAVLSRLVDELGISVLMIAGNHDSHSRLGFAAAQMESSGLHIVGPLNDSLEPIVLSGQQGDAAFFLIPYVEPVLVKNVYGDAAADIVTHQDAMAFLLEQVRACDVKGLPKVIVAHCFLDGADESESERPLSIGGADRISPTLFDDFAYAALGHLHGPQYKGAEHIRYSGSILKYSFSEVSQKKSVTLVDMIDLDESDKAKISLLPLKPIRDLRIVEGMLDDIQLNAASDVNADDYLMVRLLDKQAILDPIGKLRSVYKNVLHLERTGLLAERDEATLTPAHLQQSEMDMFHSFFEQMTGDTLNEQQQDVVKTVIEDLYKDLSTGKAQ